jgi:acyl carrier protein
MPSAKGVLEEMDNARRGTRERLIGLVEQVLATPVEEAAIYDRPLSEVGMTSMRMVSLLLAVEVEFDIVIAQSDITPANFETLAAVEALLARMAVEPGAR